jgi:polyhydroxyalkanoate synthesis regulator phasin
MDYTKMAQQMTGFYKSTIDNSINAMTMIQENTEKMVSLSLEQSPWFPEEGKKIVYDWMKAYKKGYDDLKVAADEQYGKLEAFVNLQKRADSAVKTEKVNRAN